MIGELLPLLYKMTGHAIYFLAGISVLAIDFTSQITLGSVILSFIVIAMAGIFTIRSKIATIWREEAEGERAAKERCQQELAEAIAAHVAFEREQQEIRHALKNEVVGLKTQIHVLEAKTDLSSAVSAITAVSETSGKEVADQLGAFMREQVIQSEKRDKMTHELLKEIRDKLPAEPIKVQADGILPVHETERRRS